MRQYYWSITSDMDEYMLIDDPALRMVPPPYLALLQRLPPALRDNPVISWGAIPELVAHILASSSAPNNVITTAAIVLLRTCPRSDMEAARMCEQVIRHLVEREAGLQRDIVDAPSTTTPSPRARLLDRLSPIVRDGAGVNWDVVSDLTAHLIAGATASELIINAVALSIATMDHGIGPHIEAIFADRLLWLLSTIDYSCSLRDLADLASARLWSHFEQQVSSPALFRGAVRMYEVTAVQQQRYLDRLPLEQRRQLRPYALRLPRSIAR